MVSPFKEVSGDSVGRPKLTILDWLGLANPMIVVKNHSHPTFISA